MTDHLPTTLTINPPDFNRLIEPYRRELQLHCYRILGSLEDAEDMVQETMLRAWRRLDTFEGRASLRTWLYTIATNACLDTLDKHRRRTLPTTQTVASAADPPEPPNMDIAWLEPYPDELLPDVLAGPEARYLTHESISLAFLAALQVLPPRQRAVLILRDVLDWQASEVAHLLEMTVSAVNSALHRARVTLDKHYRSTKSKPAPTLPSDTAIQSLLKRYVEAWETANVSELTALLKEEATFSMPPSSSWYQGRAAIHVLLTRVVFANNGRGDWRLHLTRANGQPALALYERSHNVYRAFALQVLTLDPALPDTPITAVTTFITPALLSRFNLPAELTE